MDVRTEPSESARSADDECERGWDDVDSEGDEEGVLGTHTGSADLEKELK